MKHAKAFAIKGIMILAVFSFVLSLGFRISAESTALIAVLFGGVSYGAGDLAFLHKTNNVVTTAVELIIAFILVWAVISMIEGLDADVALPSAFISALLIGVGEYFFHFYIYRHKLGSADDRSIHVSE
ncbi:DUF2512 family protein [Rossellomorea oryzaecorticis]|jgi:uncharacterized membrane protein YsdA (DUF1294 family)|uniref:DUF2512 family protein n=1 Tax=Rossellomorea oryzaecorticis TaxID=1396505 RepID=A0ABW8VTJ8_9BACI|nr:DUF2512 family protein [[Bacillus] enclensis]MBH9966976.1 DUF2512 family protein [[Bacillus] enclensis]